MSAQDMRARQIDEVMRKQQFQIDKLSAAFVLEVGSAEASKYELVQRTTMEGRSQKYTWRFELRTDR